MKYSMQRARVRNSRQRGFTLVEVLAALAVLGTALFVLLDAQYTALRLNQMVNEEVALREFVEGVTSWAEVQVAAGQLSGEGDFGKRYPGFSWSFNAVQESEDEAVMLYSVEATVASPAEENTLQFYVFYTGSLDQDIEKGGQKGGRPQANLKDNKDNNDTRRRNDRDKDKDKDGGWTGWDDDDDRSSRRNRSGRGGRSRSRGGSSLFGDSGF